MHYPTRAVICLVPNAFTHSLRSLASPQQSLIKLLVASLLGVIFQEGQVAGAFITCMVCAAMSSFFAYAKPYQYDGGNYLAAMSYGSVMASTVTAVMEKMERDGLAAGSSRSKMIFETFTFLAWTLPYVMVAGYLFNAHHHAWRMYLCKRRISHRCRPRTAAQLEVKEASNIRKRGVAELRESFDKEHRRGVFIMRMFDNVLNVARAVTQHALDVPPTAMDRLRGTPEAKGSSKSVNRSAWKLDEKSPAEAAAAFEETIVDMMSVFGHDSGDGTATLTGNYAPLHWQHFVDSEASARHLSQLVFPVYDSEAATRDGRKKKEKELHRPGFIQLAFANREALWDLHMMRRVQLSMASDSNSTYPTLECIQQWQKIITALLQPGAHLGEVQSSKSSCHMLFSALARDSNRHDQDADETVDIHELGADLCAVSNRGTGRAPLQRSNSFPALPSLHKPYLEDGVPMSAMLTRIYNEANGSGGGGDSGGGGSGSSAGVGSSSVGSTVQRTEAKMPVRDENRRPDAVETKVGEIEMLSRFETPPRRVKSGVTGGSRLETRSVSALELVFEMEMEV